MKQRIASIAFGLWIAMGCTLVLGQQTESQKSRQQEAEQILRELGIADAIAQLDQVIAQSALAIQPYIDQSSLQSKAGSGSAPLTDLLLRSSGTEAIAAATTAYMAQYLPPDTDEAREILDSELVKRVRNFDISLEMDGALDKFVAFQQKLKEQPVSEARASLIRRLDIALSGSAVAAMLQTEIEISVEALAARVMDAPLSIPHIPGKQDQRQNHMAGIAANLHLFSYRYMQDRELQRYVELMEQDRIQQLLGVSMKGMQQALQAGRAVALQQLPGSR
ncbi:MAG: hypothetical protein V7459_06695 [Oceanicoccus sp.]